MTKPTKDTLNMALNAMERLLKLFRIERILHLFIGIIGFLLLVYAIVLILRNGNTDTTTLVALFGSSGLITASSARITFFFNKAFKLVENIIQAIIKQTE